MEPVRGLSRDRFVSAAFDSELMTLGKAGDFVKKVIWVRGDN